MKPSFINGDLEIRLNERPGKLFEELKPKVFTLHEGEQNGTYYFACEAVSGGPNSFLEVIDKTCELIESLSQEARVVWNRCYSKVLDLGFDSGSDGPPLAAEIDLVRLNRIANLGIGLRISVYQIS